MQLQALFFLFATFSPLFIATLVQAGPAHGGADKRGMVGLGRYLALTDILHKEGIIQRANKSFQDEGSEGKENRKRMEEEPESDLVRIPTGWKENDLVLS